MLFIASIPGLLIGGCIYWFATDQIERTLLEQHERQIRERVHNIDEQLAYLETSLSHWAFEPIFNGSLAQTDFYLQFQVTREINRSLLAKRGTSPLLEKVQLYMRNQQFLIDPEDTSTQLSEQQNAFYSGLLSSERAMFWDDARQSGKEGLRLVHHIPVGNGQPIGALIAHVNMSKLQRLVETMLPYGGGVGMLFNRDTGFMYSTSKEARFEARDALLLERALSYAEGHDSFELRWDNDNYSVSFGGFQRLNSEWLYISAVPTTAITSPVVLTSKLIVLFSLLGIAVAIFLSWIVSTRIYMPVGRMVGLLRKAGGAMSGGDKDEFAYLEEQWQSIMSQSFILKKQLQAELPLLKEGFLLQLIHGGFSSYSEEELVERMSNLGWQTHNRYMVVINLQLLGFSKRSGRLTSKDEELITFAAANIAEELAVMRFEQANVINFHDLSIGLLLFASKASFNRSSIHSFSEALMKEINELLHLRTVITISSSTTEISKVPYLFEEVREAALFRDFALRNQMIDLEEQNELPLDKEMHYSFTIEREIVQFMRLGRQEETEQAVSSFLQALTTDGVTESVVQQGMLQLLGKMQNTMLQCGINPHRLYKGSNLFERLSQIKVPEDMLVWMRTRVIQPFFAELSARSTDRYLEIVEKAVTYIEAHYARDISLDECAEYAGTNQYSLSKAFKQFTGRNFVEFLTEIRMEKAKELIRETGLKIHDIAESVGYQHSYFNRIFKKLEGVTPGRYRELSRE